MSIILDMDLWYRAALSFTFTFLETCPGNLKRLSKQNSASIQIKSRRYILNMSIILSFQYYKIYLLFGCFYSTSTLRLFTTD